MPGIVRQADPRTSRPDFKFSVEARRFLLAATYGRGLPKTSDSDRIPLVIWTLGSSRMGENGSPIEKFGPRYQLFVGLVADITSELVAELDAGKPIAFRLDPEIGRSPTYLVFLNDNRVDVRPAT